MSLKPVVVLRSVSFQYFVRMKQTMVKGTAAVNSAKLNIFAVLSEMVVSQTVLANLLLSNKFSSRFDRKIQKFLAVQNVVWQPTDEAVFDFLVFVDL